MPRAVAHGHSGALEHLALDAIISSSMWALSDGVCQAVEMKLDLYGDHKPVKDDNEMVDKGTEEGSIAQVAENSEIPPSGHSNKQVYDWHRTMRFALVAIPAGIWLHAWFRLLDSYFPRKTLGNLCLMAFVDWVGESPYILCNMSMNAYLSGGWDQVKRTIKSDYIDCNLWNLVFWFPMDMFMFSFMPVSWQLFYVRAMDLIFLPVDSYFSNRSVPKAGTEAIEGNDDDDYDSDSDFAIKQKKDDSVFCCCVQ
eukprot:TRINITY_DN35233_c0_g1_i1.p1 TRINITY_DN35233_c0_g1~~TRINITY_DN35233_c0_g1_i1.p1  ORF type:complete len:253 (+),score=31.35 TRINITY_DN35233_c0_g1_i1:44-802(+)